MHYALKLQCIIIAITMHWNQQIFPKKTKIAHVFENEKCATFGSDCNIFPLLNGRRPSGDSHLISSRPADLMPRSQAVQRPIPPVTAVTCLPMPQMNSVQWAQNVGCLKKHTSNWCPFTSWTSCLCNEPKEFFEETLFFIVFAITFSKCSHRLIFKLRSFVHHFGKL